MANGATNFFVSIIKQVNMTNVVAAFIGSLFFQILYIYQVSGAFIGHTFYPLLLGIFVIYFLLRIYENIVLKFVDKYISLKT